MNNLTTLKQTLTNKWNRIAAKYTVDDYTEFKSFERNLLPVYKEDGNRRPDAWYLELDSVPALFADNLAAQCLAMGFNKIVYQHPMTPDSTITEYVRNMHGHVYSVQIITAPGWVAATMYRAWVPYGCNLSWCWLVSQLRADSFNANIPANMAQEIMRYLQDSPNHWTQNSGRIFYTNKYRVAIRLFENRYNINISIRSI